MFTEQEIARILRGWLGRDRVEELAVLNAIDPGKTVIDYITSDMYECQAHLGFVAPSARIMMGTRGEANAVADVFSRLCRKVEVRQTNACGHSLRHWQRVEGKERCCRNPIMRFDVHVDLPSIGEMTDAALLNVALEQRDALIEFAYTYRDDTADDDVDGGSANRSVL